MPDNDSVKAAQKTRMAEALLRSLGHASWAAEQTASGVKFLGGHRQAPISSWAGPAQITSTLGFTIIEALFRRNG